MFSRFFQRKSFQYEREVHYIRWLKVRLPKWRFKINVDIDQLIQTIYIHPNQKTGIKLGHPAGKTTWIWFYYWKIRFRERYPDLAFTMLLNWFVVRYFPFIIWQINVVVMHHIVFIKLPILLVSSTVLK
jgi:hypothetical protein